MCIVNTMCLLSILHILSLLSGVYCLDHHFIYVDPISGVTNSSCWYGGVDLPCRSLSLAQQGKSFAPNALIAILTDLEQPLGPQNPSIPVTGEDSNQLIDIQNCPPWMFRNENGNCECADSPYNSVKCDSKNLKTSLLDCYCMTYNSEQNETELGLCFFGCDRNETDTVYYDLPANVAELNEYICGENNRDSTMCGKCITGYYPRVYSYDLSCINCTSMNYNWIKYVAIAYIPLTFFFFFVVIFRFSGTTPLMRAFVSICQGLASPILLRSFLRLVKTKKYIESFVKFLGSVYGIWNLDFFRTVIPPICLNITTLQALALDYVIALYPLLLVVVTYILISLHSRDVRIVVWMWKPFHKMFNSIKKKWEMQGSVVNAFATFFLLSYTKILDLSFDLLVYTKVYTLNTTGHIHVRNVLYYDASVEYFSKKHLPYVITGTIVLIFVVIMPLLFLIIYPMRWCQKCLNACHIQRQSIDMFVNCYQGYYKDGTDGTRDCRCFSASFFLGQIIIFTIFSFTRSISCYAISAVILILMAIIILLVQPYKEQFKAYSLIDGFMTLTLACICIMATGADEADMKAVYLSTFSYIAIGIFAFIPLIYLLMVTLWWVLLKKKMHKVWISKLKCPAQATVETAQSDDNEKLPDRLENPTDYPTQATPFLSTQNSLVNHPRKNNKYGSDASTITKTV